MGVLFGSILAAALISPFRYPTGTPSLGAPELLFLLSVLSGSFPVIVSFYHRERAFESLAGGDDVRLTNFIRCSNARPQQAGGCAAGPQRCLLAPV